MAAMLPFGGAQNQDWHGQEYEESLAISDDSVAPLAPDGQMLTPNVL